MTRLGRFEIDATDPRAVRHLLRSALVPTRRRDAWALRLAEAGPPWLDRAWLRLLRSGPQPAPAAAPQLPGHEEAARAATVVAGRPLQCPLDHVAAPTSAAPRRLLFAWAAGIEAPLAIVKVSKAEHAAPLRREADVLRDLSTRPEIAPLLPSVLASAETDGLHALALQALPGAPLLRRQALGVADPPELDAVGAALAALHAATLGGDGLALLHGDAWSRNVLVEAGRVTGLVDWEASRRGRPAEDVRHFVRASDLAEPASRVLLESWAAGLARRGVEAEAHLMEARAALAENHA